MPPHLPRKRLRTSTPEDEVGSLGSSAKKTRSTKSATKSQAPSRKSTVFDDVESKERSAEKTKSALRQMREDDGDSSSLSSLSDAEFEDVPAAKRQKVENRSVPGNDDDQEDDDDDMEFEDVPAHETRPDPVPSGDLELTLYQDNTRVPLASELSKKGPSKREKAIRNGTHCIHVQFLLWHNAIRNSWLCDQEVQAIMISHLPPRLWNEVDLWRQKAGLDIPDETPKKAAKASKLKANGKGKGKDEKKAQPSRDWGNAAERLEKGVPERKGFPDTSRTPRLMEALMRWWKQRFRVTAPGLRRWGYMDVRTLAKLRESFEEEEHDPERHGEKITNIDEFRKHAQGCFGSRDVGAQLFTALLRGLGIEARMVASIQALGFGWSKIEEADEGNGAASKPKSDNNGTNTKNSSKNSTPAKKKAAPGRVSTRRTKRNDTSALKIDIDDSDEYAEPLSEDSDAESVIDVTDSLPPKKLYDQDLEFPYYWTEVLSPFSDKYIPVDPMVKCMVGVTQEVASTLEPRGGKAERAKQVMAYCVGFSQDGTAKDVTVRYLRKKLFPGKTKGFRMPVEKIPVYNRHGKVKRYEQLDWFKSVMRGYSRGTKKQPITAIDYLEDSADLTPAQPEKKEVKQGEETLQYYKTSKEFVLERHLKREEALKPNAEPVKTFRNKGKGGKVEEEPVFLRTDVVAVKSAETWHKQGRAPMEGAEPLKHAPYRAATTNRRREIAEAEAATGRKVLQPLYSEDQTDWIIPPPIENGVIPKNEYGNIDMFAEHMCPEGAIHVPYRGGVRVCKRLGFDFAEAVVGFEFGHRMAVPVIHGVVIAEENYDRMIEELEKDEAERQRKEDEKRRKASLGMWRKLLMGLRIADRIRKDYGHLDDSVEVFGHTKTGESKENGDAFDTMRERDEDMAGGFLPEGYEEEEEPPANRQAPPTTSSFFTSAKGDDEEGEEEYDPFEVDHGDHQEPARFAPPEPAADPTPEPVPEERPKTTLKKAAAKPKAKPKQKPVDRRRRTRKKQVESSEEEEEEEDDDDFELPDSDE